MSESRSYTPRDVLTNDYLNGAKDRELEARFYSQLISLMVYSGFDQDLASYKVSKLWFGEKEATGGTRSYRMATEKFIGELIDGNIKTNR